MSAAAAPTAATMTSARAGITLGMLAFVYVLNFLDRQLISILAKPIQDGLGITDGQLGLLTGFYFALFYCFIAIPIGWLADRTSRVKVLSAACAIWSAATAACGMAANYGQLVAARMMVGVGEAGGVPPSYAIISDTFPRERRTTAMAIFNLGPPIGSALGVAFGASLAAAFDWRMPFYVIGGIGVVTALVVYWVVREPERGETDVLPVATAPEAGPEGFFATIARFFRNPLLLMASLASGAGNFITYGLLNFTVLFLMREKGMVLEDVAVWYALVVGIGICAGMFSSGRLIDRLSKRSRTAYAYLPALGLALGAPFFAAFVWAESWQLALVFLLLPTGLNYFYLSPAVTLVQEEVRPSQRVLAGALLLLVMNLIGLGFGPAYLGLASDFFRSSHPDSSLQMAFYTLIPFYVLAVAMFLRLARTIRIQAAQENRP